VIAVDTNVLVRALVDDPSEPRQCAAARELIVHAGSVRVSLIVFVETLWVLDRSYRASRAEVSRIAIEVLNHPRYNVDDSMLLQAALQIFAGANVDFADAVALADAQQAECALYTFDRKLAKLAGTNLLKVA
jgi:predicted nucleic-acid-binding protein